MLWPGGISPRTAAGFPTGMDEKHWIQIILVDSPIRWMNLDLRMIVCYECQARWLQHLFFVTVNAGIAMSILHISLDLARDWNNWSVQPEVVKTLCRFVYLISFKLVTRGCTRNWKMATPRPVHRKLLNNNYNSLPLRGRAKLLLRSGVLQALQYWSVALWEREKVKRCCLNFDFAKLCSEILFLL